MINSIVSNNKGNVGGLSFGVAEVSIINSNIVNNRGALTAGGIYFSGSNGQIINSIITGNSSNKFGYSQIQLNDDLSDPDLIHTNIQDGIDGIILNDGHTFTGLYDNCLDIDPMFIHPSEGEGPDYDGMHADWSVLDLSPQINAGTPDISGLDVGSYDLLGHSRINNNIIDIGAIENQGSVPSITLQPAGKALCSGESIHFQINCPDTVHYQWQKNGVDMPGETTRELFIDAVSTGDQGNYWCIITNSYGSVTSNTATLFVNEFPEFLQEPENLWAQAGEAVSLRTFAKGTSPAFQWQKDGLDIPGKVTPELNLQAVDYSDEGEYRCILANICGADTTAPSVLYLAPQLCMVTFDPASGNNLVVWEKKSDAPIDLYNIYRESSAAGIYDLLGTLGHSDLSVFVDTTADPTVQAYLYKITAVDDSGYETDLDLCAPHKTIHLLVSTNPELNTTQLEWDKYYGFPYQTYIIYRSPTGTGFTPIHYMASTLNSWTDPSPLADIGYYRIGVEKLEECVPTGGGKKADPGPYSHAMSNTEDNRLQDQGNQPPDTIILSNNSVDENLPVGSLVGRLETVDPDTSDYHVYKLVAGEGDDDNQRFTTLGDLLVTAEELDYETQDTCNIRLKTTDKGDLSYVKVFLIVVNDVDETIPNEAPTDLTLTSGTIAENMPAGTMVGRLWTEDPDVVDSHTYSLVAGEGSEDNDSFMVLGDMLLSDEVFDYEEQDTFRVRVQSADQGDLTVEKVFIIVVTDVSEGGGNQAPTAITLSANIIEENRPSGSLVGAFITTDPDAGDDHAYVLVYGLGSDDNDDFMIMGNILISGAGFDYETRDTLYIRVNSTDEGGLSYEEAFIILVTDVFEAEPNLSPTDILLSSDEVDENMPALTMIGRLQTDDPNMDDYHTYRLVEGEGSDDNESFVLVDNAVFSARVFDFEEQDQYTIRVRSTDDGEGELVTEKSFTIMVNDVLELGMSDLQPASGGISIYPNPFTHSTMIEFPNPDKGKYRMYVTDLSGKVVYSRENIFTGQLELDRNNLPAGVYFVDLRGTNIYRGRLIIE